MRDSARRTPLLLCAAAGLVLSVACTYSVRLGSCPVVPPPAGVSPDSLLHVQYLGVGGVLLRRGEDVVLTAPLYSNPSLVEVLADHAIRTDPERVERFLPDEADRALAILVGHAHYDHMLDVPYIAREHARAAAIYGSFTVRRLLAFDPSLAARVVLVEPAAGSHLAPGRWLRVGPRVRVMALRSMHSDQVSLKLPFSRQRSPFHLWRGEQRTDVRDQPRSASDWPEGRSFAFVIDFLGDRGRILFRVYYQDSGTNLPEDTPAGRLERTGYPPRELVAEHRFDVAILCVGGDAGRLRNHPAGIIEWTRPRFVVLGHWEDFFVTQDAYRVDGSIYGLPTAGPLQGNEVRSFKKKAEAALRRVDPSGRVWLPCPTRSRFSIAPR